MASYFHGHGKGNGETGTYVYDETTRKLVRVSDKVPTRSSAAGLLVGGEVVSCKNGGEVLDFGKGPHFVKDSAEKRRVLRKYGVMPAPRGVTKHSPPELKVPSFGEFFYKKHGTSLQESPGLVKNVPDDWGKR
jgi:hypothetical protein